MFSLLKEKYRMDYKPYGGKCPQCGCYNTYFDAESGIHWCGDCDCEW